VHCNSAKPSGLARAGGAPELDQQCPLCLARSAEGDLITSFSADLAPVKRAMLAMQRASWEQGVAAQALLELGDLETVILMAKAAIARIGGDGRLALVGAEAQVTDPAANGEPVLRAAEATSDPLLFDGARRMLDYLLYRAPRAPDGTLYHLVDACEVWVDSLYMAPPFMAVAGHPDQALLQIEGHRRRLWSSGQKLFSHIWDDAQQALRRPAFWGVGNGWAAAGMTRVLGALAHDSEERGRVARYLTELLDGCLAHERADGLFHDVLDDQTTFVETNLGQMLAYAIYRGILGGWLDEGYRVRADRMRRAAREKVDAHGLVQGVCGSPGFDRPGTATEGQAFFLLMEAAARELSAGK
jgi:unsaturated rhamnogalacturonyl hydrolase